MGVFTFIGFWLVMTIIWFVVLSLISLVINAKDILYARGYDDKGTTTIVYLCHNMTKKIHDEICTGPTWVKLDMTTKEFYKKWEEAERKAKYES